MVDDSMEISSDHGAEPGDDDIDIDIDITTGQIDEDDILDDATSNVDLAESSFPQPSSLVAADDVMIDDDGTYNMNDADPFQDEQDHIMDHENMEMSFAPLDESNSADNEEYSARNATVENSAGVGELAWQQEGDQSLEDIEDIEDVEESNFEDTEAPLQNHATADPRAEADAFTEKVESQTGPPINNDYVHDVHDSNDHSPQASSPKDLLEHDSAKPVNSESAQHSSPRHNAVKTNDSDKVVDAVASAENETANTEPSDYSAEFRTLPDIVVVYQSMEYALFGASDSEDPDSFFLTDPSIFDKSISDFFKAMRDVIHDDLSPEEELCLSVDDLGLEIEETVSSLHDVTLAQISQTYEKLLHNDEVETPRPLCLSVGTRPSFAKRLASLISCAAAGKGLSQVITLDEQPSEGFDESGVPKEDWPGDVDAESINRNIIHEVNDEFISNETQHNENGIPSTNVEVEQERPRSSYDRQEEPAEEAAPVNGDAQQQAGQHGDLLETQESPKHDLHTSTQAEEDEEGDLIDYSEEEDHAEVDQRSTRSQISPAPANGNDINKEYEKLNEEPQQRSSSGGMGQTMDETIEEQESNDDHEADREENSLQPNTGVPYDLDNADQWDDGDAEDYEKLSSENVDSAIGGAEDNHDGSMADRDKDRIIESSAATIPGAQSALEEVEYTKGDDHAAFEGEDRSEEHDDEQREDELQDHLDFHELSNVTGTNGGESSHEIIDSETGATDAANSSATLSADEHQDADKPEIFTGSVAQVDFPKSPEHLEATGQIHVEDEIGYEDDEVEQDIIRVESSTTQVETPANYGGSGKRTRADNDSDDTMSTKGKDTKRHRT